MPVYTVALGTHDGVLLRRPARAPGPRRPARRIADITGGKAYESQDADSVSAVYSQLGTFIGHRARAARRSPRGRRASAPLLLVLAGVAAWRLGPRLS